MKQKVVSILLALTMLLGLLPSAALALDGDAASVDFTVQADGAFLLAPQRGVRVEAGLAESYGYTDSVTGGVSALDVLVKAHELLFGQDFTAETKGDYLALSSSGFITTIFGENTSASGFILNGAYPNDGTESANGGYNGTTAATQEVVDGDLVEFFLYQDASYYSDQVVWFCRDGSALDSLTVRPGAQVSLTLQGVMYMMGYLYPDAAAMHGAGSAVSGAQLAWVDADGTLTDVEGAVTGEDGAVSLTVPEEGTYALTAYMPAAEIEANDASPLILSLLPVTVSQDAPAPAGPCDLTALSVASFQSNPGALELTPAFSSDVTAYSVPQVAYDESSPIYRSAYVKAACGNRDAVITAACNGVTAVLTSGDAYWKLLFGALVPGQDNLLTVTVAASDAEDAETKTYTVTVPMAADPTAPALAGAAEATAEIRLDGTYTLDLRTVFTDPDTPELTYTVSVDGGTAAAADADFRFSPAATGTYTLAFTASDGKNTSPAYTVTLTVTAPDAAITVPGDAELFVGSKVTHYVPFTEVPAAFSLENGDGTVTYYFELTNNSTYNYRVSGEDYITYGGTFKKAAGYTMAVTAEDLQPAGKTRSTVDRDVTSNGGSNVGDVYLNINAQGYLKLDQAGDTYQLVTLRNWEAIDGWSANYFIEPDYHFTVLREDGTASDGGVVTVSDSGLVTAVGEGTAIVLVTYDAMTLKFTTNAAQFYGAVWPENTGVFVVSVGAGDSGITTGMTLNEGRNAETDKLSGDALDAEHDVIYFTGDAGSYTFTPGTAGCTVSVAVPTVGDVMTFSGFETVAANAGGSFTVPLAEGRNIVKVEKDGRAEYQVITAKPVSYTVNDGAEVRPGDSLSVKFDTLYHPANKLAGVYNMSAFILYSDVDGYEGQLAGSTANQYTFASNANAQTLSKLKTRTEAMMWGSLTVSYKDAGTLTIPADWAEDTFTLSGGTLVSLGYGDPYGNHRGITLTDGKAPNFNAKVKEGILGQLPDIVIPVVLDKSVTSIEITAQPTTTAYFAGDSFDPTGMTVAAAYSDGSTNDHVTSYTVSPQVLTADTTAVTVTYGGKTATVPVTVTQPKVTAIAITAAPNRTGYTAGDVFDPTGMVVTATYENGKTAPVTSYTYAPQRTLTAGDTAMTITYTGSDAAEDLAAVEQPITVRAADPDRPESQTITVSFTLKGDSKHGEAGGPHTLKAGNLETWVSRTRITVDEDAKVIDVLAKALSLAGIPYENPTGNYVTEIRGLAEFDNGPLSGWMYTLNGTHPDLGVNEQAVKNGDVIVFHYTDDYTVEEGSDRWSSGGGSASVPAVPETPASGLPFADVAESYWAVEGIRYVYEKGLMQGTGATTFSPEATTTRGMIAAILYRLEGSPAVTGSQPFSDVSDTMYCADAVRWAEANGIANGYSDGRFGPGEPITREQLAAILYRYAVYKGYDVTEKADLSGFADAAAVSTYAVDPLAWANAVGLINGTAAGTLIPRGGATRAQAATILMRWLETAAS